MNFLLKLLGLEPGADVHRLIDGTWSAERPMPWQFLALIGFVGLTLARSISCRGSRCGCECGCRPSCCGWACCWS